METPPLPDGLEEYEETWVRLGETRGTDSEMEIEELIVGELVDRHGRWIEAGQ